MSKRYEERLPNKAQINAISDIAALEGLKDEIDKQIVRMETDLEFRADEEWAPRAINALALHRHVERLLFRRISSLKAKEPKPDTPRRPPEENRALTQRLLVERVREVDLAALTTLVQADAEISRIAAETDALEADREDEISLAAAERDEAFMATSGTLLRQLRHQRQLVQNRRGEINRAAKVAEAAVRDQTREVMFVQAAREVLDRETYMRLWDRVDRMEEHQRAHREAAE